MSALDWTQQKGQLHTVYGGEQRSLAVRKQTYQFQGIFLPLRSDGQDLTANNREMNNKTLHCQETYLPTSVERWWVYLVKVYYLIFAYVYLVELKQTWSTAVVRFMIDF